MRKACIHRFTQYSIQANMTYNEVNNYDTKSNTCCLKEKKDSELVQYLLGVSFSTDNRRHIRIEIILVLSNEDSMHLSC